jgi:hypothetical protein
MLRPHSGPLCGLTLPALAELRSGLELPAAAAREHAVPRRPATTGPVRTARGRATDRPGRAAQCPLTMRCVPKRQATCGEPAANRARERPGRGKARTASPRNFATEPLCRRILKRAQLLRIETLRKGRKSRQLRKDNSHDAAPQLSQALQGIRVSLQGLGRVRHWRRAHPPAGRRSQPRRLG